MKSTSRIALLGAALMCPVALAWAAPRARKAKTSTTRRAPIRLARASQSIKKVAPLNQSKLPRFVSMATIKRIQREFNGEPYPGLQPFWQGQALKRPMSNLLTGPSFDVPELTKGKKPPVYLAQGFPRPIPPAGVPTGRGRSGTIVPNWVRYPLEFQLCGIGIGTKAVDKDRFNRIDRYGLFALHGNPTAVVLPVTTAAAGGGAGGAEGAPGGSSGGRGSSLSAAGRGGSSSGSSGSTEGPGGAAEATGASTSTNLTLQQTPPEAAALFPNSQQGGLPDWALAITVQLNQNQVEWLYKRDTYAMGFVVDRLGYCEAIIVAGIRSPIARTQLEDPIHTVKLGDDLRKVMFRYGYPDATVPLGPDPVATANSVTGTPGGGGGSGAAGGGAVSSGGGRGSGLATGPEGISGGAGSVPGGSSGAVGAESGGAAGGDASNGAFRTYDVRYDQTYNTVFTIRNNRVVRMYIFGDPDFFNAQRRNALRTRY